MSSVSTMSSISGSSTGFWSNSSSAPLGTSSSSNSIVSLSASRPAATSNSAASNPTFVEATTPSSISLSASGIPHVSSNASAILTTSAPHFLANTTSGNTTTGPITSPVYTLYANGSGLDYAVKCNEEWSNYNVYITSGAPAYNTTETFWSTYSNYTASVSWLCNSTNLPHVIGSLTLTAVQSMSDVYTNTVRDLPSASPSCSVRPDDCVALTNLIDSQYSSGMTSMDKEITSLLFSSTTAFLVGNTWTGFNTTTFPAGLSAPPAVTIGGTAVAPDNTGYYTAYYTGPWGPTWAFFKPGLTGTMYGSGTPIPQTIVNCTTTRPTGTLASQCGQCTIGGGRVELMYFPPPARQNSNREMCRPYYRTDGTTFKSGTACPFGATRAAMSGEPTRGRHGLNNYCYYTSWYSTSIGNQGPFIVSEGSTYYEDMAYLSLESATAEDSCGPVGGSYTGRVVGLPSSDVYSVCGWTGQATILSYDFADLQAPVPPAAYNCQPVCGIYGVNRHGLGGHQHPDSPDMVWDIVNGQFFGNDYAYKAPCGLIVDEWYKPRLAVPPQIRQLDPAWANCALDLGGLYDPPIALTAATTIAGPSGGPTPEPASPGGSKTSEQPPETNKPSPAPVPTPTDDPGAQSIKGETSAEEPAVPSSTLGMAVTGRPESELKTPSPIAPTNAAPASNNAGVSGGTSADPANADGGRPSLVPTATTESSTSSAGLGDAIASAIASIIGVSPPAGSGSGSTDPEPPGSNSAGSSDPSGSGSNGSSSGSSGSGSSAPGPGSSGSGNAGSGNGGAGLTNTGAGTGSGNSGSSGGSSIGTPENPAANGGSAGSNTDPNAPVQGAVVTVGTQTLTISTAGASGAIVVGTQTVQRGGALTASNGAVISAQGSGVVVAGSQVAFTPLPTPGLVVGTIVDVGGQPLLASQDAAGNLVIGTATLSPGQVTTLSGGTVVSAGLSDLVIDGKRTVTLEGASRVTAAPQVGAVIAAGSQTFTVMQLNGGAFAIGGTTVMSGQVLTLGNGQVVSAGPSGLIIDGTSTVPLRALSQITSRPQIGALMTAGSQTVTALSLAGGTFVVGGTTLTSGQSMTLANGDIVSVGSSGLVVDGTRTVALQTLQPLVTPPPSLLGAVLTVDGQIIIASQIGPGTFVIGTETIKVGETYNLSNGEVISAGPSGLVLDGTSTITLSTITPAASSSLVTLGGQVFSAMQSGSVLVIGSLTLTVGGADATINGVEISAAETGLISGATSTDATPAPTGTGVPSQGIAWRPGAFTVLLVALLAVALIL